MSSSKPEKSDTTKQKYENIIKSLIRKNINIQDVKEITKYIKKYSLNYQTSILSALIYYYKNNEELLTKYTKLNNKILKARSKETHQKNRKIIDWSLILKKYKELHKHVINRGFKPDKRRLFVASLFILIPPRRLLDYINMYIVDSMNDIIKKDINYYVKQERLFIFNSYKTSKTYGRQQLKIPIKLYKIIENYINETKLENGELLLGMLNTASLTMYLKEIFGVSVDILRHSYINKFHENTPSNKKIKLLAEKMGHSINLQFDYRTEKK